MNIYPRSDATSDKYVESEFPCFGETNIEALKREFKAFSPSSNETLGGKFIKSFLADEIYRIVKPALENVEKIKNETVRKQAKDMISDIADLIVDLHGLNIDINRVPPLHSVTLEDDSFLLEWIFSKYRIGFVLDKNLDESLWYLVSTIEKANLETSGMLADVDRKKLLVNLISYVFSYS